MRVRIFVLHAMVFAPASVRGLERSTIELVIGANATCDFVTDATLLGRRSSHSLEAGAVAALTAIDVRDAFADLGRARCGPERGGASDVGRRHSPWGGSVGRLAGLLTAFDLLATVR